MTNNPYANQPWLAPWEQAQVIEAMLRFGILNWDNDRNLPLKSGGTTDIYVNMRQARNSPAAMRFFAEMFCNPISRLRSDRIAEIPQAVTCFAGLMADQIDRPLVTIRETPKAGRVSDANIIGSIEYGERIALFDDVITDGGSKIPGYQAIRARGANPTLVVAVDRQQGWERTFADNNVDMPVWAGLTLHDIRAYLINNQLMERCSIEQEERNCIIVALDGRSWEDILPLIDQLRTTGAILKVNDLAAGIGVDELVPRLQVYGRVMVDLKTNDTPPTVANTCRRVAAHNPWASTIHASGSGDMIAAAVQAFKKANANTIVLAVTVLTSIDPVTCQEIFRRRPLSQVKKLATIAWKAGARGFVCSPQEVSTLRKIFPNATLVIPGVRSPGVEAGGQKRIDTPQSTIEAGADYIVGGRQFLNAPDPVTEILRVLSEELGR